MNNDQNDDCLYIENSQKINTQNSEIIGELNQFIDEIESTSKDNFFEGNIFYNRRDALSFIREKYEFEKKLIHNKDASRGSYRINLRCSCLECSFRIVCKRNRFSYFVFIEASSCLQHGVFSIENNCFIGFCTTVKKASTVLIFYRIYLF